jgi:bifunctional non-homologous end joining protein LigD
MTQPTKGTTLYCREGRSDKVYQLQLEPQAGGFVVNFQFGRRGSTLQSGTKTPSPTSYGKASKIYDRLVAEKKGKGYTEGETGTGYQGSDHAGRPGGLLPQLSNPVEEHRLDELIADDRWLMQEKKDGRRMLLKKTSNDIQSVNRSGVIVPTPDTVFRTAQQIGGDLILDDEAVGDVYWAFDLLQLEGEDLRGDGTEKRFAELAVLLDSANQGSVRLIPCATTAWEKRRLFERLKAERAEGVVFKRKDAAYVTGRPASGGDHLKFKFTATATCRVLHLNEGKRSVALAVYQDPGAGFVEIGNVTIPVNCRIPAAGALVEVRYLYAYVDGSLYQPVYLGERNDVATADSAKSLKFKQGEDDEF